MEHMAPSIPTRPPGLPQCHTGASTAVLVRSVLDSWWLLSQLVILGITIAAVWKEEVWGHPSNTTLLRSP